MRIINQIEVSRGYPKTLNILPKQHFLYLNGNHILFKYILKQSEDRIMNYELLRFIEAHQLNYQRALSEIESGKKVSHWMWYIFPQIKGLGRSSTSEYYGIRDLDEAKAYLADPMLGKHLVEICNALLALDINDATEVMGRPDDKKLKSSMTLFDAATESSDVFQKVLDKYYRGEKDYCTLKLLGIE